MRRLEIENVLPGQRLARVVLDFDGDVLLQPGVDLTRERIEALTRKGYTSLAIDDGQTRGIEIPVDLPGLVRRQALAKLDAAFNGLEAVAKELQGGTPDAVWKQLQQHSVIAALRSANLEASLPPLVVTLIEKALTPPTLDGLNAIRMHHPPAFDHSINVCVVAIKIGQVLGLSFERMRQLTTGCLLHDLGKVFVPREILEKRGKLSPAERHRVEAHTTLGYRQLRTLAGGEVLSHHIALQHHERQDGKGYPRALTGTNRISRTEEERYRTDRMLLLAEIAVVADFYAAITGDRPHRPAMPCERVLALLQEASGSLLNREIVNKFLSVLPTFPTGTEVLVVDGPYSGCRAVVALADKAHLRRPKIRILADASGKSVNAADVDLMEDNATQIVTFRQALIEKTFA